jgi:hypothetical protein
MTWRPRFLRPRQTAQLGAAIVTASLRRSAEEYASTLVVGDTIVEETDGPVIGPIRHLLPRALAQRGLALDQVPGGWRIIRSPFPAVPTVPAECSVCGASWFSCKHGVGLTVAINWDDPQERKE